MSRASARLAVVGAGRMGGAMVTAWARNYAALSPDEILVVDPAAGVREDAGALGCQTATRADRAAFEALDTVVVAVKPQSLPEVAPGLADALPPGVLLISLVAGVRLKPLHRFFPGARVVRAMPNTPAANGAGATAFIAAADVTEGQRVRARALMEAGGVVEELDDEDMMDAVTGMSGSGPAYVFLLAEALAEAGVREGLPRDVAQRLATATVAGAGAMLAERGAEPAALRAAVTSPGGATEAALGVLRAPDGLYTLMESAVATAAWRAKALGR